MTTTQDARRERDESEWGAAGAAACSRGGRWTLCLTVPAGSLRRGRLD